LAGGCSCILIVDFAEINLSEINLMVWYGTSRVQKSTATCAGVGPPEKDLL